VHLNLEDEECGELDRPAVEQGARGAPRLVAGARTVSQEESREGNPGPGAQLSQEPHCQPLQSLASGGVPAGGAGDLHAGEGQPLTGGGGLGALSQARRRGGPAAGWMALAGWQMALITKEEQKESDLLEKDMTACYSYGFESDERWSWLGLEPRVMTWRMMREAAVADEGYQVLVSALPKDPGLWPQEIAGMARYRDKLSSVDGVLMFGDRLVVPKVLRSEVMGTLHAGHQGVKSIWHGGCRQCGGLR
jgi:hypothetical protein